MSDLAPSSPDHQHLEVGRDTFVLSSTGSPIRFSPIEKKFLVALDKTHDLQLAAEDVGKDLAWANSFFRKPKIHEWMTKIAQEQAAQSGMTVRWVRGQFLAVIRGKEVWWEGECSTCHVKQKTWIEPDDNLGTLSAPCLACAKPVLMNQIEHPVRMDRQQMVALQELASRIDPKVERISHEFSDENFVFQAKD